MDQLEETLKQCQEISNTDKMEKYKLIKAYPGSLEVGTEVVWGSHGLSGDCYQAKVKAGIFRFSKDTIEKNPEFWQKVPKPEFQILNFTYGSVPGLISYEVTSNESIFQPRGLCVQRTAEQLLEEGHKIHSVKRLSDGLVITVGDTVVTKNVLTTEVVTGFRFNDGKTAFKQGLWVTIKNGGMHLERIKEVRKPILVTEDGVPVYSYNSRQHWVIDGSYEYALGLCRENVKLLQNNPESFKVFSSELAAREYVRKNTPLFITEDGVKIFEKDSYWYVDTDFSIHTAKAISGSGLYTERKYFSTEQLAQTYITRNQPRLSIEDCLKIRDAWHSNRLGLEESIREYLKQNSK